MTGCELPDYAEQIHQVIGPLIPHGSPLALFDFPSYCNVGDNAIWMGESDYLKSRHPDSPVVWVEDTSSASSGDLPKLPAGCVILLQGGGNFGDLWPHHQKLRESVVAHYRDHRIVQFPQSIHFENRGNWDRCRQALATHPDFHLVVRDQVSLDLAHELNKGGVYLCPDMALQLGSLVRPVRPMHDIFALMRTDREKTPGSEYGLPPPDCAITDWDDQELGYALGLEASVCKLLTLYPRRLRRIRGLPLVQQSLRQHYDRLAARYLRGGCALLGSGRVVITDRLHGHILCSLMGIPHVTLDISYGKIRNLRATWHTGDGLCQTAETWTDALAIARNMLKTKAELQTGVGLPT